MNKKDNGLPMAKFSFALLPEEKLKIEMYARNLNVSPSELARTAIRELILNIENPVEEATIEQTELAYRVRKMEERMAALLAKLTRAAAQTLYFTTLPYMHGGLPKEPLPEGAVRALWGQSRQFAGDWLKKAQPVADVDEQTESTEPANQRADSNQHDTDFHDGES